MPAFDDPAWLETERRLLQRAKRGDERAFGQLIDVYGPRLLDCVLTPVLRDKDMADDALVETLRTVWDQLPKLEVTDKSCWNLFHTIAKNRAIDMKREAARRGRRFTGYSDGIFNMPGEQTDLVQMIDMPKVTAKVHAVIAKMENERYRKAIEVAFVQELPREQCAELFGVNVKVFNTTLSRALDVLRTLLDEEDL